MPLSTIDLEPFLRGDSRARAGVAEAFGRSFETTGFAVIVGHGVPETLSRGAYDLVKAFFALPTPTKRRSMVPETVKRRGYLPIGVESVAATLSGETPPDLCEALVFPALHRDGGAADRPVIWPDEPAGLRDAIAAYAAAMATLTAQLSRLAALALNLPEDYLAPWFRDPSLTLRFVNYPDQAQPPRPGQLRYGAHHDYGGLTILRQDSAPGGLQICDADGTWRDVGFLPGSFLLNVGDLMSRWTNGRWRSTLHRVVNPDRALTGSTQRLSMVAFSGPNETMEVACLPSCCSEDNPPRFAPVQAGAYVRAMANRSMNLEGATG